MTEQPFDPSAIPETRNTFNLQERILALAERIVQDFQPGTLLEIGCGDGALVVALRQRGVQAWGLIQSGNPAADRVAGTSPYCLTGSVTKPFTQSYELVLCLETLPSVDLDQDRAAIHNICTHTGLVLFASSPFPIGKASPVARPVETWAALFAEQGFLHDIEYDPGFIAPWAMLFYKGDPSATGIVAHYERRLWGLGREAQARRQLNIDQKDELVNKEREIQRFETELGLAEETLRQKQIQINQLNNVVQQRDHLVFNQNQNILEKDRLIFNQNQIILEKETMIQDITNSRSWRLLISVHKVRHAFIPPKSRREETLHTLLRAWDVLRRDGLLRFTRRALYEAGNLVMKPLIRLRLRSRRSQEQTLDQLLGVPLQPTVLDYHTTSADIIVCVHDALEDVQRCLESVIRYTQAPYRLILVDDGSQVPAQDYLVQFAADQGALLSRNEQAGGYTRAANQGLRASSADFIVLLNSDTIVTSRWLDRMIACAESDEHIGLVGPLSNTASWQSVPAIFDEDGDWALNPLPEGMKVAEIGEQVAQTSARLYPRLPVLNGFCMLIRRALIEQIGYFDEDAFGEGYGEENDYCLRARKAGWQIAVADDAYVYHAQSRSYSHERRKMLAARADQILASRYGPQVMSESAERCRDDRLLLGVRAHNQVAGQREALRQDGLLCWEARRLLFVLPIADAGGGGNVVAQEAEAMLRMGVDVRFVNLKIHQTSYEKAYPGLGIPTFYTAEPRISPATFAQYDAVVGTVFHSLQWMPEDTGFTTKTVRGYYIQDFEPDFFSPDSAYHRIAWESYTCYPDLVRFTKTEWNREIVQQRIGVESVVVGPSVDIDLFRPRRRQRPDWPQRPLRIAAMIRPSTPRRQPELTLRVLKKAVQKHGGEIEVVLFGCRTDDPEFQRMDTAFAWQNVGMLTRQQLAVLLNEVDIFTDFSVFQAMGLTGMEAMACGAAVILPQAGGAGSFAIHENNALIVDTASELACQAALERLIADEGLRTQLQRRGIADACRFYPEQAAYQILSALFPRQA